MSILLVAQAGAGEAVVAEGISTGALLFMLTCMALVSALTGWCFYRVLTTRRHFDPDGTGPAKPPVSGRLGE